MSTRTQRPSASGYSGTPLARKLGVKPGCVMVTIDAPPGFRERVQAEQPEVRWADDIGPAIDIVQVFATRQQALRPWLARCRSELVADAMLWVSWPKKASKVATDITEDRVRDLALPLGFVDIKVCAVDDIWSGLKLVVRKSLR
ncbi:MAG: hypothetical protein OEY03_16900, partial [Rhizobacter sp.]|nr:hypothetical protein [Rhizobacter sp.]